MKGTGATVDFEKAQELENDLVSKLREIKRWGDNHSGDNLYEKISQFSKEMRFLLYKHGLIESYQYGELTWESKYRVNVIEKIIVEFFESKEEKKYYRKEVKMAEKYSNERRFEDIKKLVGDIVTRVDGIEENETLLRKNFEGGLKLFVEEIIWLFHNKGLIEAEDFFSLQCEIRKEINDLLKDIFGIEYLKDDDPKLCPKSRK